MSSGRWHCETCRTDYAPYIRIGDTIRFWSPAHRNHVEGTVISVEGKHYTICLNGAAVSVDHSYTAPVQLISRPGLPVTYEEHFAYLMKHGTCAPNIHGESRLRLHGELKKERV
jgi:hypothetical protein